MMATTKIRLLIALCLVGCFQVADAPCSTTRPPQEKNDKSQLSTLISNSEKLWVIVLDDPRSERRRQANLATGYSSTSDYKSDPMLERLSRSVVTDYHLKLKQQWPINSLDVHCLVVSFLVEESLTLANLAADKRVKWVQVFQQFSGLQESGQTTENFATAENDGLSKRLQKNDVASHFSDPYYQLQPAFTALNLERLTLDIDGTGTTVAMVDSGIQTDHKDLAAAQIYYENMVGVDTENEIISRQKTNPAESHGTAVASLIVAQRNNGEGIAGVAPGATLFGLRGCWESTDGQTLCDTLSLSKSLQRVVELNPDILNLSLSGPADRLLEALLTKILEQGTVVVTAFDAKRNPALRFPQERAGVLVARDKKMASQLSEYTRLLPGENILTAQPVDTYSFLSGSSLSSAYLTGVLALLKQVNHSLAAGNVAQFLAAPQTPDEFMDACKFLQRNSSKPICR